jgi:hypothetical protein
LIDVLRYDDQNSIASMSDLSDVRDDVFMGYNDEDIKMDITHYKVEAVDISDDDIDQVVPTRSDVAASNNNDESLDVIVLYVN